MYRIYAGELSHHGILGQKWGIRRYQNLDGSLTDAGKSRLEKYRDKNERKLKRKIVKTEQNRDKLTTLNENNALRVSRIENRYVKKINKLNEKINRIKKMSYSDMLSELSTQRQIGADYVNQYNLQQITLSDLQNRRF